MHSQGNLRPFTPFHLLSTKLVEDAVPSVQTGLISVDVLQATSHGVEAVQEQGVFCWVHIEGFEGNNSMYSWSAVGKGGG